MRFPLMLAVLAACSDKGPPPPSAHEPGKPGKREPIAVSVDPTTVTHLDDDVHHASPEPAAGRGDGRPIDVTLRSTPTGAQAFVDGAPLGPTPTFWAGLADGRPHEFTFELHGFALARYRFVPVTSGVIHARLEPIVEETDAGVPSPIPPSPTNASPPPAPDGVAPPPAPPFVPDAAPSGLGPQP